LIQKVCKQPEGSLTMKLVAVMSLVLGVMVIDSGKAFAQG
jgi:hypothetical protein